MKPNETNITHLKSTKTCASASQFTPAAGSDHADTTGGQHR